MYNPQAQISNSTFFQAEALLQRLIHAEADGAGDVIRETLDEISTFYEASDRITQYKLLTDLIERGCRSARNLLRTALLTNESALVRHEAAFGLGVFEDPEDQAVLIESMLRDKHLMVRHEAAIALGVVGDATCLAGLAEAINDREISVSESADFALRQIHFRLGK